MFQTRHDSLAFLEGIVPNNKYDFRYFWSIIFTNPTKDYHIAYQDNRHIKNVICTYLRKTIGLEKQDLPRMIFFVERSKDDTLHTHILMEGWRYKKESKSLISEPYDLDELFCDTNRKDYDINSLKSHVIWKAERVCRSKRGIVIKDVWSTEGSLDYLNKNSGRYNVESLDFFDADNSDLTDDMKKEIESIGTKTYPLQKIPDPSMPSKSIDPSRFHRNKGKKRKGFRHRRKHRRASSTQDSLILKRLPEGETVG